MIAKAEAAVSAVLMATPWWVSIIAEVNTIASAVAAICGAVVGIHAVYRIWKHNRKK